MSRNAHTAAGFGLINPARGVVVWAPGAESWRGARNRLCLVHRRRSVDARGYRPLTGNGPVVENETVIIDCFWSGSVRSAILSADDPLDEAGCHQTGVQGDHHRVMIIKSVPAQQDDFGTESRTHRHQHARASTRWMFGHRVAQYVQYRGRRNVSDFAERAPGQLERVVGETQGRGDRLDHLRTTGMADPGADLVDRQIVRREELGDVVAQVPLNKCRDLGAQDDLESGSADVPAHRAQ